MTGPWGMGPLKPYLLAVTPSPFMDDFNRANGDWLDGTIPSWTDPIQLSSALHPWYRLGGNPQIISNEAAIATNFRAIWFNPCSTYNQFSEMTITHIIGGTKESVCVRMPQPQKDGPNPSPNERYSFGYYPPYTSQPNPKWTLEKTNVSGTTVTLIEKIITAKTAPITFRLVALDCGSLGTMLLCYEMIAGVPTFIMGFCDEGSDDLVFPCVGVDGGKDTIHVSSSPMVYGDNWSGGDFTNPETIDLPRLFVGNGEIEKDGSTWQNVSLVGTGTAGVRGGGSITSVAWLCVGGGGGGGGVITGGGGGGGVKYGTITLSGTLTCVVGAGGNYGGNGSPTPTNGTGSSITGTALTTSVSGGGHGSGTNSGFPAGNGSSGGGGRGFNTESGGTGIGGEGFAGGNGVSGQFNAAGGGGAGAVGRNANVTPPHGGDGKQWPTASGGDNAYYGGGGGGGSYNSTAGTGGLGGGGTGGNRSGMFAQSGSPRTGGGGGGAGHNDAGASGSPNGGNGGTGVIKFRSQTANWSP